MRPLSTTLPSLIASLQAESLAVAQAMINLTYRARPADERTALVPNVLTSPWVMRIVFISECLSELSAALHEHGADGAGHVAATHQPLVEESAFGGHLPADKDLHAIALRQLQIERRYAWLCQVMAGSPAARRAA